MADIDVCNGAYHSGSTALAKLKKTQWPQLNGVSPARANTFERTRWPFLPEPAPIEWPESPSDDGDSSDGLVHQGFENIISPPPQMIKARTVNFDESALPPTPPTMNNSDANGSQVEQRAPSPLTFADDAESALEHKASGSPTSPVNAVSPPTPGPSPPAVTDAPPFVERLEKPQFLSPTLAPAVDPHLLKHYPSSRAESFLTAREDQPRSTNPSTSHVHLPENDTLPEHWLDNTRDLELADLGLSDMVVKETPKQDEETPKISPSAGWKRKSKHESPPQTMEGDGTDWEKHISYVSGPDELDVEQIKDDEPSKTSKNMEEVQGLGLFGAGLHQDIERSAEDVNNMVYKRIREENVIRHSAVSAASGAITVGIIVPPSESTPRTLKRQTKNRSLRGDNGTESNRGSVDGDSRPLTHKKVRLPERNKKLDDSPVFESSIRQVSSPARLGPDASDMTALTFASLQDSPSARQSSKFQPVERKHTLRHLSHGDRLSNNLSIRRTSLHGSPSSPNRWLEGIHDAEAPVESPPRTPPRKRELPPDRIGHNVGVKRSSTEGAKPSRILEKSSNPVRGVIPSVSSEPDGWSPTTGRLRRFSREERLENNGSVRRTSISNPSNASEGLDSGFRPLSLEKPGLYTPSDPTTLLSSPRKSLDARFLHPTTTPGSVSVFSDRTADVELCEASGVRIYPHNNDSLLLVQNGSRPVSKDNDLPDSGPVDGQPRDLGEPIFAAQIDPPTPKIGSSSPAVINVDSPLTNPRAAPEPPVFKFIPPTPNQELERQLSGGDGRQISSSEPATPQRRLSLLQRARRYSDTLFIFRSGGGSLRRPRREDQEDRDVHLSPLWRPQGFWDDFDSDEDESYYDDLYEPPVGSLPKGGDTSDLPEYAAAEKRGLFPRKMSKRLPGFRGRGGFLQGNSLGIERWGTNGRRHYVGSRERVVVDRRHEIEHPPSGVASSSLPVATEMERREPRVFVVPFSGGRKGVRFLASPRRLRDGLRRAREDREERRREKRREVLRTRIGGRVLNE